MDTWIPALIAKPCEKQLVYIKLVCFSEVEGVYDFKNSTWRDTKGDRIDKAVLAWKKKDGENHVGTQYCRSAVSEPNGYA